MGDGSIRMWEEGWFSIIGDAPTQGINVQGGARIYTSHYQTINSSDPAPQIYLGDGDLWIPGGTDDGTSAEMKLKLHNIQFYNDLGTDGANGYGGSNIILGRHGQLDFEIDNCKFYTIDAVNMAYRPDYTNSGGAQLVAASTNWYFTNTTWVTEVGQGPSISAYPNWDLQKFRNNVGGKAKVILHNSKFTVRGNNRFTGDVNPGGSTGNSGHIITNCYSVKAQWWMSWSNNVFYAPSQQLGNGTGVIGDTTWYMWDEITAFPLGNYLDLLGSSISDNQIVGYYGGFGNPVFFDTMGNIAVALLGNNSAATIMDYSNLF